MTQPPTPTATPKPALPPRPPDWRDRIVLPTPPDSLVAPPITLCLPGDTGSGKTQQAMTFPDPFFIYSDANVGKLGTVPYISVGGDEGYKMFDKQILPAINARDPQTFAPYQTIVVDSFSFLQGDLADSIPDLEDESRTRGAYRTLKKDTAEILRKLTKLAIAPRPGAQVWNVIVTVHEMPTYKVLKSGRDQQQILDKYSPKLEGGARDTFYSYFNTVLLLRCEKVHEEGLTKPPVDRYYAYSKSPDQYHTCKDSVGGPPNPWKKLPPKMDVTDRELYGMLVEAWGFPKESK